VVNHFYVNAVDAEFGPFFLKFRSYFPTTASSASMVTSGPNARPPRPGSPSLRWTTASPVEYPTLLQAICDRLGPGQIDGLLRKWLAILPHPFTAAGYRYDVSILQAVFSLTQVLDQPVAGRVFFEHIIRDNPDAGRPDQISLILSPSFVIFGRVFLC
jgi:hypothetical protein